MCRGSRALGRHLKIGGNDLRPVPAPAMNSTPPIQDQSRLLRGFAGRTAPRQPLAHAVGHLPKPRATLRYAILPLKNLETAPCPGSGTVPSVASSVGKSRPSTELGLGWSRQAAAGALGPWPGDHEASRPTESSYYVAPSSFRPGTPRPYKLICMCSRCSWQSHGSTSH